MDRAKESLKQCYNILILEPWWINPTFMCNIRAITTMLLAITAFVMSLINFVHKSYPMAVATAILAVGLLVCSYMSGISKKPFASALFLTLLICSVFTYFALKGGADSFAILWVLLVPMFAAHLLGIKLGLFISLYFLIFLLMLFYTPINVYMLDKYSTSFMLKFPVLYICDCTVSLLLSFQKEFYNRKVHLQANLDELTGSYNRRYFTNHIMKSKLSDDLNTCIMVIDINGLKEVNDRLGHEAGDELICAVPSCCKKVFKKDFTLCRIGGDEFVLLLNQTEEQIKEAATKLKQAAEKWRGVHTDSCSFSIGWASSSEYPEADIKSLFSKADFEMYNDKTAYYQQTKHDRRRSDRKNA